MDKVDVKQYINTIQCCDCLEGMRKLPDKCVDLVVTSPPYNLKNSTGNGMKDGRGGKWSNAALINGYATYDDNMPYDEYCKWQKECLTEMYRLIKDDGAIFYNHKWRVQGGLIQDRHEIVQDFPVRQIIIWKRKGGINFNPGYFLPTLFQRKISSLLLKVAAMEISGNLCRNRRTNIRLHSLLL